MTEPHPYTHARLLSTRAQKDLQKRALIAIAGVVQEGGAHLRRAFQRRLIEMRDLVPSVGRHGLSVHLASIAGQFKTTVIGIAPGVSCGTGMRNRRPSLAT